MALRNNSSLRCVKTGQFNAEGTETRTLPENEMNAMATDALATWRRQDINSHGSENLG